MEYEYDSWNRRERVTYPDGEAAGRGYTKHYYAESERITSQIGRGNFSTLATPVTDTATANRKVRRADSLVLELNPNIIDIASQLTYLTSLTNRQNDTCEAYWYHPDHLGSSSWITDSAGTAVQYLHYLPWGEDYVNQRLNGYEGARYTFSAKEKDPETGLSYFGSRYYSSDLSIWLSVDPMASKYPSLSPYVYCADNPVRLVDPNGEEVYLVGGENAITLAIEHISNHSKLNISINEEGRLEAKGIAWTKTDRAIKRACRDERVQLFMHCKDENSFLWSDGSTLPTENGGGYNGNFFDDYLVIAQQNVCPSKLAEFDKSVGDKRPGLTMIHELLEGYLGGLIAFETGKKSPKAGIEGSTYQQAHNAASKYVGGNRGAVKELRDKITISWRKWPILLPSVTISTQEVLVGYKRTND